MTPTAAEGFDRHAEHFLLKMEEARDTGVKVCGVYCIFAPVELIHAAGVVPAGLCGKQEAPIPAAEETLPANLCPLIKSSYGYAVTGTCPFFSAADFIVGETTCDGKKKMFELMGRLKPLHLMHLPYTKDESAGFDFWYTEIRRFKAFLQEQTGQRIHDRDIRTQIRLYNRIREAFQRLLEINLPGKNPVGGMALLPAMESKGFIMDPAAYLEKVEQFASDLESVGNRPEDHAGKPRILLTGTPLGKGSEKVLKLIEEAGAVVVCMENCTGIKGMYTLAAEDTDDPVKALAKRYLETPCSCMTPNAGRIRLIQDLVRKFDIQGVVDLSWQCCLTYQIEAESLEKSVTKELRIPYIHLATDYSTSDTGQLGVRIEAFIELLGQ
ncbi:MAG: double-cubane-cluster-containing anaerobic reductase [Desulfobacteraceae bacterium]